MSVTIGQRQIGGGAPCFIVFEAGATHDGLDTARDLVRRAAEAGADAVKFQIFDPDRLVADRKQLFTFQVLADRASGRTETVSEPLYDILCRRCMPREQWRELKRYADGLGLAFFSTVGFEEDVDFLAGLGCSSLKIASADITHFPLIRYAAKTGIPLQIDTGNATLGEVEAAVNEIVACGNRDIVIHHCPSGYPARLESIHLRIIQTLRAMFDYPIAYSDHTPGWDMDIAAIALGASMVEKTITHDRMTRQVEHMFSLEPADMRKFITAMRELETAFGSSRKQLSKPELENRAKIRRSAHLKRAVRAGESLTADAIDFRRPGYGIQPHDHEVYLGMKFVRDMAAGLILMPADLTGKD